MTLPPGFLDDLRDRLPLSRIVGRKVTWDNRKSNAAKGDFWAPCPFHQEKTPSFHVDDRKGFYYCFGCHAKGDAVTFLRETENMSFMDAVEVLAREAGIAMPARDPATAKRADRRSQLVEVMERAARFYRMQLSGAKADVARDYLRRRGLSEATAERFGVGFASPDRQGLRAHLAAAGVPDDLMVDAGLVIRPDDGGTPYDRFRGRIMFPIRDARERCIAFGGRALDPAARAKYLNSPETELFDKGRTLYNLAGARAAAGKGQPLVVAEGYMDVIALVAAGFEAAVAPLGTAITETQLRMIWQVSPEPVIALDGDAAGLRAGERLMDLALPLIEAGQGLRFALLPDGCDPDDLIRRDGRGAMQAALEGAVPMVTLLWRRETEGRVFDSPERRAAFDKALRTRLQRIADASLRRHYGDEIARLRAELFATEAPWQRVRRPGSAGAFGARAPTGGIGGGGGGRGAFRPVSAGPATESARRSALAAGARPDRLREALILAICASHPVLIGRFAAALEQLDTEEPAHARLRDALLRCAEATQPEEVTAALPPEPRSDLEKLMAEKHVRMAPPARPQADVDFAALCLAEELAKLQAGRGMERELREAMEDIGGQPDEGLTWRLTESVRQRRQAERMAVSDASDMDEDRAALSGRLQAMIDNEVWIRRR